MGFLENIFESVGKGVSKRPWLFMFASAFVTLAIGAPGFLFVLETESRAEFQWVPRGAVALDHSKYAGDTWPGSQQFNFWVATCKGDNCNILDQKYVDRINSINERILKISINTSKVKTTDDAWNAISDTKWNALYNGTYSFDGSVTGTKVLCSEFGPGICGVSSILGAFPFGTNVSTLTNQQVLDDLTAWNNQAKPRFELNAVASAGKTGIGLDADGNVTSAKAFFGFYTLSKNEIETNGQFADPITYTWQGEALCVLGIQIPDGPSCEGDDLMDFTAQFSRSLGDEFGATVAADVPLLIGSFVGIIIYMGIMLSRRDPVYSMVAFSFAVIAVVGMSYIGALGLGGFFGVKNNNLANLVIFLLLGLGVDDAFVLTSEFRRHSVLHPEATPEECTIAAAKHGGVSILITSLTDAVAFLVGSITVLPALGWFCAFCGLGVVFCFFLQIFFLLPFLLLTSRREESNRYDCLCCVKSGHEHSYTDPSGCCVVCKCAPDKLPTWMEAFAKFITTSPGVYIAIVFWLAVLGAGIAGMTGIYKDFKIEWFVPDDSYIQNFFSVNEKYFETGQPCSVYVKNIDYFAAKDDFAKLNVYITTSKYVDQKQSINNWYAANADNGITATTAAQFYNDTHVWWTTMGQSYQKQIQWVDPKCDSADTWSNCDATAGIAASKIGFDLSLEYTNRGQDRFDTMTALRSEIGNMFTDFGGADNVFPFSFRFLYWEEVGVIDTELWRNLGICAGVIIGIVCLLIPSFRVAPLVLVSIGCSIIEVIGFMHWWGVTISGVSTIYILISVGLSVDYSAHIAHIFVISTGSASERAVKALTRIGPSTFNAVISTLVAVVVLSASTSYVFRLFFKALCLVVLLGGGNGIIFLPAILSQFGGSKDESDKDDIEKKSDSQFKDNGFKEMSQF